MLSTLEAHVTSREGSLATLFPPDLAARVARFAARLPDIARREDLELLEINPLVLTPKGRLIACDAKIISDDSAGFRHDPEDFPLSYLPAESESLFKEALGCYAAGFFDAFGSMARRTAQSLFRELGERGKLELFDTLQEIRTLAELDDDLFADVRGVLFGADSDPWPNQPRLDQESAGILLEVMRDLLYQTFVRRARLVQAVNLRRGATMPPSDLSACARTAQI